MKKYALRATPILLACLAKRWRTQPNDMFASMLQGNEDRLVDAILKLLGSPNQRSTEHR